MKTSWFTLLSFSIIVACALQSTCAQAGAQRETAGEKEEVTRTATGFLSKFDGTSFVYGVGAGIALQRFHEPVIGEIQAWATRIRTGQVRNQNDFWALGAALIVGVPLIKYGFTKIAERLSAKAKANQENLVKTEMNQPFKERAFRHRSKR